MFLQFRFADHVDQALIVIGIAASIISGLCPPIVNFALAAITNVMACYETNRNNQENSGNWSILSGNNSMCNNNPTENYTASISPFSCTDKNGFSTNSHKTLQLGSQRHIQFPVGS